MRGRDDLWSDLKLGGATVKRDRKCPSSHHDECSDHDCVSSFENHKNGTVIAIVIWIWIGRSVQHGNFGLCDHERLACGRGPGDQIDHVNGFKSNDDRVYCSGCHDHERACLKNN